MLRLPRFALAALVSACFSSLASARASEFLSSKRAAEMLVEGHVWSALTRDGKQARITFERGGTGTFEGPMTLSMHWEVQGADVCVHLGLVGTKCLRFRAVAGDLEGWNNGEIDLRLSR